MPVAATVVYYLWLWFVHGVPASQAQVLGGARAGVAGGDARLLLQLLVVMAMYAGLFVLPVAASAAPGLGRSLRPLPRRAWRIAGPAAAVVVVGGAGFASTGRLMPYVPQYVADWGMGPADLQGGRPPVAGRWFFVGP